MHKFTDRQVQTAKVGRTQVTGTVGLYINVNPDGSRRWVWRYTKPDGRPSEMGLGRYPIITLAAANERVLDLSRMVAKGEDPVQAKRAAKQQKVLNATRFGDVMANYVTAFAAKGPSVADMAKLLTRHAAPLLNMPIADVNTPAIANALAAVNTAHPLTARQALNGIRKILKYAKVHGLRTTADDADWHDVFAHIWAPAKAGPHHRALPYTEIGELYARLELSPLSSAWALQMLILCASRTGEVLGAQWDEIDMSARTWTIPASRMKMRKPHVVPLSDVALEVLDAARLHDGDCGYIFKGMVKGKMSPPRSNAPCM
jgi:integrase